MTKDERIKELESAAMQLFDMVHESENIQNKIKANDLYDTITVKNLSQHLVSGCLHPYDDVELDDNGRMVCKCGTVLSQ